MQDAPRQLGRHVADAWMVGCQELPADVCGAVCRLAKEPGVDPGVVSLAAPLKVAAVLTATTGLVPGEDTWRGLIGRKAAGEWRERARSAWRQVEVQAFVTAGQAAGQ